MDELQKVWNSQESLNELKQKLHYVSMERDAMKELVNEEIKKHRDQVEHMNTLLRTAYKERDQYKSNLQMLLTNLAPNSPDIQQVHLNPQTTKANSSVTESNSLSDVYNHTSHGSPGVDSFLEGGSSSPYFPTMNIADSVNMPFADRPSRPPMKLDRENAVIENLARGLVLPKRGKLLSSVMEAGPLLQSLLVAGSLPQWKNPPPLQPYKIPPVSMAGNEATNLKMSRSSPLLMSAAQKVKCFYPQADTARSSLKVCSASLLDFSRNGCASGIRNMPLNHENQVHAFHKRARLQ